MRRTRASQRSSGFYAEPFLRYFYEMQKRAPEILYEAGDWIILNKPAGLPVQAGRAVRANLVDELAALWGSKPYLVHRLDRDTAGCLVAARTATAAARMARVLADPATRKIYLAIVYGVPVPAEGEIHEDIFVHEIRKSAVTHYKLRQEIGGRFSLLELTLDSGRMHQIRIHLAGIGHPILGDDLHGDFALNKALRKEGVKRLLLFARRLELAGGIAAEAPYPEHFAAFMRSQ
ncbi:MAG: RluA family pseudouridine synthase [Spirochaetota bacterium]|jgi:23S rRNA pseudouridine955/2504/2580 synthase|nr:RluA family pseudouridine synthase [Spirochaetota bacterium]